MEDIIDYDALFKKLLTTFFLEFVAAFLPEAAAQMDFASAEFQPQEILADIEGGERHIVDLLVKVRLSGQDTFFLIHIENQSRTEADFAFRMFKYAALLHIKYHLPVYSVVIFSHDAPKRREPNQYRVSLFGRTVLQCEYKVVQLNRLLWRKFIQTPNPAAAALMTKMSIAPKDRLKVTREIVRMIATLKLDPARSDLIGGFMRAYLRLTADEMRQYERRYSKETREGTEKMVLESLTITGQIAETIGMENGIKKGKQEGKEEIVTLQLNRRFGSLPPQIRERLDRLSSEELNALGLALFDFTSAADLDAWLANQTQN